MATLSIMGLYQWDNEILSPLLNVVPDTIDKPSLQTSILAECGEMEILYSDPDFFKIILGAWAEGKRAVWDRISKALTAEYNITENYDRSETWTDTGNGNSTSTNQERGYPQSEGFIDRSKNLSNGTTSSTHTGRVHGNIGVRSAQELVEQELALAEKADLEEIIVKDFKKRFCLLVY